MTVEGTVREVAFMGASTRLVVDTAAGETLMVDRPSTEAAAPVRLGDRTTLTIDTGRIRELEKQETPGRDL